MVSKILRLGSLGAALWTAACGAGALELSGTKASFSGLDWYMQCPTDPFPSIPPSTPEHPVLVGQGPFSYYRRDLSGTPVTIHGRECPPVQKPRDAIFMIDVSSYISRASRGNDKEANAGTPQATCGRFQALTAVLQALDAADVNHDTRYGFVTFDQVASASATGIETSSKVLYATGAELIKAITNNGAVQLADVACKATDLDTDFKIGFQESVSIFNNGGQPRAAAQKEIYFISGDEPVDEDTNWPSDPASLMATDLKTNGVTVDSTTGKKVPVIIATIFLQNGVPDDEQYVRDHIASSFNGTPLHVTTADPAQLPSLVTSIALDKLFKSTISHGPTGGTSATIDTLPFMHGNDFVLPAFNLTIDRTQTANEVRLDYFDTLGEVGTVDGLINWMDD